MRAKELISLTCSLCLFLSISACGSSDQSSEKNLRDNTPHVLTPSADGSTTIGNNKILFDLSHSDEGYVMVKYSGNNNKVKVRIYNPGESDPYTYDLTDGYNTFPLTGKNGSYKFVAYENISGKKYSQLFSQTSDVTLKDDYSTYLYPNQYVNFNESTKTVGLSQEVAEGSSSDLDVVEHVYDYMIKNISYDYDKADLVKNGELSGYLPDVDTIINDKKGICFDFAAVAATMLRAQGIPTRMMIGYAALNNENVYHAWIGVYTKETGWIDDLIEFDGQNWKMLDPTFASENKNSSTIRDFISNEKNYTTRYLY